MHPAFLKPVTRLELGALFTSYVLRKWRFQVSDFFGQYWHQLAKKEDKSLLSNVYKIGNRLTTRKTIGEYFFRMIPNKTEKVNYIDKITFIFPPSISEQQVKSELQSWILETPKYGSHLFLWSILLPVNFYVAKFLGLLPANAFFAYHIYRLNSVFRAFYGARRFQTLVNTNRVEFEACQEWGDAIIKSSDIVSSELLKEGIDFRWEKGNDIHDDVALILSAEFKLPELLQTVRRTRLSYYVHGNM